MSCIEYKVVRLNVEHDNIIHLEGQLSTRIQGAAPPFWTVRTPTRAGKKLKYCA